MHVYTLLIYILRFDNFMLAHSNGWMSNVVHIMICHGFQGSKRVGLCVEINDVANNYM